MSLVLTSQNIPNFPRSDVQLASIDGLPRCGLRFMLALPDDQRAWLTCSWITELRMDLKLGKNSGMAMTWDIDDSQRDSRWRVRMDFAHAGAIEFGCEEATLEYVADPRDVGARR